MFSSIIHLLNGFRKFSFAFLLLATATMLLLFDHISGKDFVNVIAPVGVAFMGANGIEHACKTVINWLNRKKE